MKKKKDYKDEVHGFEDISKVYIKGTRHLNKKYIKMLKGLEKDSFYESFYNELIKIFPCLTKKSFLKLDNYQDWFSSTCGWVDAMINVLGEKKVHSMYKGLDWYDCDFLDGEIEERLSKWYKKEFKIHD